MTIRVPICLILLLYQEMRWEAMAGARLLTYQQLHYLKSVPPPAHFQINSQPQWGAHLFKTRCPLGI